MYVKLSRGISVAYDRSSCNGYNDLNTAFIPRNKSFGECNTICNVIGTCDSIVLTHRSKWSDNEWPFTPKSETKHFYFEKYASLYHFVYCKH